MADYNGKSGRLVNKADFGRMAAVLKHVVLWVFCFSRFVYHQFIHRRGLQTAASLAYTTLLSIVPLVGVMFSFFGNLPVFKDISEIIQEFVFGNFVPAFGQTVQEYLINFSVKASQLTATGIIVLVVIALLMMSTIESAFNHIWNVLTRRRALSRFLTYWAILTVGPILVGIGLYSTSYLLALPVVSSVDSSLMIKARVLTLMPFITTGVAFGLMYILIPNCYVNRRNAVIGGLVAALLFEMAKTAFGLYVKAVPTYETIYGAIAVIPMFLIWIYLSWLIVLLGAQITYCLSVFRLEDAEGEPDRHEWGFMDACKIIAVLWQAQKAGRQLSSIRIKRSGVRVPHVMINQILELLQSAGWALRTEAGDWMLARDINELTLYDLFRLLPCKFPEKIPDTAGDPLSRSLRQVVLSHNENMERLLGMPLGEIFRNAEK